MQGAHFHCYLISISTLCKSGSHKLVPCINTNLIRRLFVTLMFASSISNFLNGMEKLTTLES